MVRTGNAADGTHPPLGFLGRRCALVAELNHLELTDADDLHANCDHVQCVPGLAVLHVPPRAQSELKPLPGPAAGQSREFGVHESSGCAEQPPWTSWAFEFRTWKHEHAPPAEQFGSLSVTSSRGLLPGLCQVWRVMPGFGWTGISGRNEIVVEWNLQRINYCVKRKKTPTEINVSFTLGGHEE